MREGPLHVFPALNRIKHDRGFKPDEKPLRMDHLFKTSPDSITALFTTMIRALGHVLSAEVGCRARQMADVVSSVSLLLGFFGERDVGRVLHSVVRQLQSGGELLLCYLLLLCTGLSESDEKDEMWRLLEADMVRRCSERSDQKTVVVVVGLTNILYLCGEGSRVFFPWIYGELRLRGLVHAARQAWTSAHGNNPQVWDNLAATMHTDEQNAQNEYQRLMARAFDNSKMHSPTGCGEGTRSESGSDTEFDSEAGSWSS